MLKKAVDHIMTNLKINEQFIKETHEYTQILPEKYYLGHRVPHPGSARRRSRGDRLRLLASEKRTHNR
jgi:hypothetical protein